MPGYEKISAVVSVTLIGLALYFVLDFPQQVAGFNLFGTPLNFYAPQQWLMVLLLAGLVMAGTDSIVRTSPQLSDRRLAYVATFWPLPALLVVLATQTLGLATSPAVWGASLVVVGVLLWLTIATELALLSREIRPKFWPQLWQQFIGYAIALGFYILIYQTRTRSAVSATAVMLVSGAVSLALLRNRPDRLFTTWLFAAVIGLSLGQITWALNYWRTGALNAGLLLFLAFYVLVGLAQQHLRQTLSQRTLVEFGVISAIALVVIYNL
jgi:intracellular septation protein A